MLAEVTCFRCGGDEGYTVLEDGTIKCNDCGEYNTMVSYQQALDIINDLWVSGVIRTLPEDYYEEYH